MLKIGISPGSARQKAFSRAFAEAIAKMIPDNQGKVFDLGALPMFNQDYDDEGTTPEEWIQFRKEVAQLNAVLFVTPEYNRSYTPLLKNAIDIASRPPGQNLWVRKPGAIISVSPGRMAGFGANYHLRQTCAFLNMHIMGQPEAFYGDVAPLLEENMVLTDAKTLARLQKVVDSYLEWISSVDKSIQEKNTKRATINLT